MKNKKRKTAQNKNTLIKKNRMLTIGNIILFIVASGLLIMGIILWSENKKQETVIVKTSDENYVFLGDSITDWYPISDFFSEQTPIVNSGIAGYKTTDILNEMNRLVYRYNPTDVFIEIGINDLNVENPNVDEIYNNIIKIVNGIKEHRPYAKVYLESIYPINSDGAGKRNPADIKLLNKKLLDYCERTGTEYIDIYGRLSDETGSIKREYTTDGLHLSKKGYSVVSNILNEYIEER